MTAFKLTSEHIEKARQTAGGQSSVFFTTLQSLSGLDVESLMRALAEHTRIPLMSLAELEEASPDFAVLGYAECLQRECVLVHRGDELLLVSGNPLDEGLYTWVSYRVPGRYSLAFVHPLELQAYLARLEGHQQALSQIIGLEQEAAAGSASEEISLTSIAQDESQVVRLVNSTLYDAHKSLVSDIHFENTAHGLVIKYRIDGVLSLARQLQDLALAEQVISRIKVMAELDIGEKRIPQDGRFSVNINGREIDFRVSIMPGLFGEDAVLRILDKQSITVDLQSLSLDMLGIDEHSRSEMRRLANHPYGMLLVTGPTGSGKTTTLYATLSEINHGDDKIVTIEDPVEYQLPGILQIPVNEKKGLSFARGLRSILRHDPDRILVGEIRDRETAEIAVQAALTGHLVYTTVHANNVFDVLSRFKHMGVDPYSFVTALNGVVAQRLVRLICKDCAAPYVPADELLRESGVSGEGLSVEGMKMGRGCASCRGTGYKGRRALTEILVMSDEIKELILQQAPISRLKGVARANGMRFMRQQAIEAVMSGTTTFQEINRVTFVE